MSTSRRRPTSYVIGAVTVGAVAWLANFDGPGVCPHDPEACFFSEGYASARLRFRDAAARLNATIDQLHVSKVSDLTIDVAVLSADTTSPEPPTLVLLSGTHGVEAYAGSAIQLALLERWAIEPDFAPARLGIRVVLVHAVNPFGFKCGRRWNEDGIDLNRNILDEAEFVEGARIGSERQVLYDKFKWLFNRGRAWTTGIDDLIFGAQALYGIAALGAVNIKRAVVCGQYHQPAELYFGGHSLATSHRLLLPHLQRVAAPSAAAILVDVHTGLGPSGVDTLIPSFEEAGQQKKDMDAAALQRIFVDMPTTEGGAREVAEADANVLGTDFLIDSPSPSQAGADAANSGYELAMGTTARYARLVGKAGWRRALAVTQEFGTVAPALVLRGMAVEQAEFRHRPPGAAGAECGGGSSLGSRTIRDVFYVQSAKWQRKVVRRGVRVAMQAVRVLAEAPDTVPAL